MRSGGLQEAPEPYETYQYQVQTVQLRCLKQLIRQKVFGRPRDLIPSIEGCYWVVEGKLLAGPYPGDIEPPSRDKRLRTLLKCGVRKIIDLTQSHEVFHYSRGLAHYEKALQRIALELGTDVVISHFPIIDRDVPSRRTMSDILDDIDGVLKCGDSVYVHCWGGLGRTGTVVGCYLARHNLALGDKALERIVELRRNNVFAMYTAPQTSVQRDMVRSWKVGE